MLLDKVLKLLRTGLLAFLFILHSKIVLNNLFNAPPKELHHLRHVVSLAFEVCFLLLQLLFFFDLTFAELLAAHPDLLLSITLLLLPLAFKVFLHPEHFFYQVLVMGLLLGRI